MKQKNISKLVLGAFMCFSLFCLVYVNKVESNQELASNTYEELNIPADKLITSAKSATVVFGQIINFITKREV